MFRYGHIIAIQQHVYAGQRTYYKMSANHPERDEDEYYSADESADNWLHLTGQPGMHPSKILSDLCDESFANEPELSGTIFPSHLTIRSDGLLPKIATTTTKIQPPAQILRRRSNQNDKQRKKGKTEIGLRIRLSKFGAKPKRHTQQTESEVSQRRQQLHTAEETIVQAGDLPKMGEDIAEPDEEPRAQISRQDRPSLTLWIDDESTLVDFDESSRQATPDELYGRKPTLAKSKLELVDGADSPEFPLTPIEGDLFSLAILAGLPDSDSEAEDKRPLRAPSEGSEQGCSILTPDLTPEATAWHRRRYIPGPIRVGTDLPLVSNTESAYCSHWMLAGFIIQPRDVKDDLALDEIVDFFADFGLSDFLPHGKPGAAQEPDSGDEWQSTDLIEDGLREMQLLSPLTPFSALTFPDHLTSADIGPKQYR